MSYQTTAEMKPGLSRVIFGKICPCGCSGSVDTEPIKTDLCNEMIMSLTQGTMIYNIAHTCAENPVKHGISSQGQ